MKQFLYGFAASLVLVTGCYFLPTALLTWEDYLMTQPPGASELATRLDNRLDHDTWIWGIGDKRFTFNGHTYIYNSAEWITNGQGITIINPEFDLNNNNTEIFINDEPATSLFTSTEHRSIARKATRIAIKLWLESQEIRRENLANYLEKLDNDQ